MVQEKENDTIISASDKVCRIQNSSAKGVNKDTVLVADENIAT